MPTLDWIGKKAMVNHHREVPYRLIHCDKDKSFGDSDAGSVLSGSILQNLPLPSADFIGQRIVYEEGCSVPEDRLSTYSVLIKQIPYQIEGL